MSVFENQQDRIVTGLTLVAVALIIGFIDSFF